MDVAAGAMAPERVEEAAAILLANWRADTRIAALPEACRPGDRADGYRVAAALARQTGDTVAGWKIAATSAAGQKHINVDGPLAGRILKGQLVPPEGTARLGGNVMRVAEAEFAFAFGRDLAPRDTPYSQDEVMAAVSALHLSIEVPDSRYADFTKVGAPSLIADTACASWLTLGTPVDAPWRGLDLAAHVVTAFRNGEKVAEGTGAAVLGDPRIALAWLAGEVARHGGGIRLGDIVTTGTCVTPVPIAPGDRVTMDYGALGRIEVRVG